MAYTEHTEAYKVFRQWLIDTGEIEIEDDDYQMWLRVWVAAWDAACNSTQAEEAQ